MSDLHHAENGSENDPAFDVPPIPRKVGRGLAVTSMVLGILSVIPCLGVFLSVPALIISVIALFRIRKGKAAGKAFAVTGVITASIGTIFALVIFFFAFMEGKEEANKRACSDNLRQIATALNSYSIDYDNYLPPFDGAKGLELLRANDYLLDTNVFVCPASRQVPAVPGLPLSEDNVSYVYKSGVDTTDENISKTPILWDKNVNHKKYGNILYRDFHIEWSYGPDWQDKTKPSE